MPHKILVTVSVLHEGHGADYLQADELIRGVETPISVTVTNLADDPFPGGTIKGIGFSWGDSGRAGTSFKDVLEIGRLEHLDQSNLAPSIDVKPLTEGQSWLSLRVEATDDQPVECFQSPDEPSISNSGQWHGAFYTVNREHLHIISLLSRLLQPKGE